MPGRSSARRVSQDRDPAKRQSFAEASRSATCAQSLIAKAGRRGVNCRAGCKPGRNTHADATEKIQPDHPISITRNNRRVVVKAAGHVIADSQLALRLQEASYPPVLYIPREDVDMSKLQRTEHTTYCPFKGDCSYYSIPCGGSKSINAVWSYERPYASVTAIESYRPSIPAGWMRSRERSEAKSAMGIGGAPVFPP